MQWNHPHVTLAVAVGIGTATASGLCAACAYADTGDSSAFSVGPASTASAQSADPGPRRPSRADSESTRVGTQAGRTTERSGGLEPGSALRRAAADRNADALPAAPRDDDSRPSDAPSDPRAPIQVKRPDAAMDPPPTSPEIVLVESAPKAAPVVPALASVALPAASLPQSVAVTIASPPAAGTAALTTVNRLFASLSEALPGGTPTTPADASVAVMMGAARRASRTADQRGWPAATGIAAAATTTSTATTATVEAERLTVSPSSASRTVRDRTASGGYALALSGSGTASATITLPASTGLTIRARASAGAPNMTLAIDGVPVTTVVVKSTKWTDYTITGPIAAGPRVLSISSTSASALQSLYLDKVTTRTGPFVEEFVGTRGSAPGSLWTVKTGRGWTIGTETYSTKNATLDGQGRLVIQATQSRGTYTSGWVESKNTLSLGYGTTTARIKVPKGQGLWPAFWLKGADEDTTAWPNSGEIDVLELPSTSTTIYSTLHGPISGSTTTQQAQIVSTVPDLSTDFHNYWVRHLPNEITFGVDGQTLGTLTPDSLPPGAEWVYNRPMHVILNLAVGGPWAGAPDSSTRFPAAMVVDWVRWDPV